ncbi:MAG: alpha-ribazole phosphatase [Gallionella sp.]
MQTLYLIRHTQPNISTGICYGQLNMGVGNSFEEEAANVQNWLPPLDLIITSPLLRTRKLADFLAQTATRKLETANCKPATDVRLMEKHFGAWEGCAWDQIERNEIDAWAADIMGYAPTGGESAHQVMLRVEEFLRDLAQLPQRNIALVAHGGTIRAILAQLAKVPMTDTLRWQIDYGAVISVQQNRV